MRGFSKVSRRNLLRKFARINRTVFRAYEGRVFAITLTYPTEYPDDPEICNRNLKAPYKRLTRKFGDFAAFWRMGIQERGAWHFHLLLFMPPSPGLFEDLRRLVPSSWHQICGDVGEGHLLRGTRVEEIRNWRKATSYAERYVAKVEGFPEGAETGRIWGAWNEKLLPVKWETVEVGLEEAYRIRRIYRRLARIRGRGHLCRLTVFVRHENVVRLLEFLGYPQVE